MIPSDPLSIFAAAREAGAATAIVEGDTVVTYAELAERVRARAASLVDALDPRRPYPVIGAVTLDTAVTLYALFERRVPALLLHPRLTTAERDALLAAAAVSAPLPKGRVAAVLYTSGTAGTPRAAVLSRDCFVAAARASEANLGWRADDRWLLCMPLAHVGGLSILTRCLAARRCVVLWPRFEAQRFAERVDADGVTLASLVPAMLAQVLDACPDWQAPPRLRAILLGGAQAPPQLLQRAAARHVPIVVTYGLTEACSQVTATRYASRAHPAGERAGRPLPGVDVRVVEGRIEVRGETLMDGYWNEAPLPSGAWFDTGDLGEIDERGCVAVHARRVDLIVTAGENVYPAEVEAVLETCPGVKAAAVFAVPHELWGQTVAAALVATDGPMPDTALQAWMRSHLAPHKRPRSICYLPQLPLTRGGKLDRRALPLLASALLPLDRSDP